MNQARAEQVAALLRREGYQALICRLPQHVLMLTGYLPVLGNSFCLISLAASGSPEVRLAVPKDEEDLLPNGSAVEVRSFAEETMQSIENTIQAVDKPLSELLRSAQLNADGAIGYEGVYAPVAPAYTQVGIPGPATLDLLRALLPGHYLADATLVLNELAAIKTDEDVSRIRRAEQVARQGFLAAREAIVPGATETDVAAAAYAALLHAGYALSGVRMVLPFVHVMAGARAAEAYRAFNLTLNEPLRRGDTVSVQMEVGVDGYWAELSRTFFAGEVRAEWARAHHTCEVARDTALGLIHAGASGRAVDSAARTVLQQAGLGDAFKHGLGHGIGFQAINHAASPVLHPASESVLESGMVHNIEPAVYLEGKGGLRLNDNVVVQPESREVLSSALPSHLDWLTVTTGW